MNNKVNFTSAQHMRCYVGEINHLTTQNVSFQHRISYDKIEHLSVRYERITLYIYELRNLSG